MRRRSPQARRTHIATALSSFTASWRQLLSPRNDDVLFRGPHRLARDGKKTQPEPYFFFFMPIRRRVTPRKDFSCSRTIIEASLGISDKFASDWVYQSRKRPPDASRAVLPNEDIRTDEILDYLVETEMDRSSSKA